MTNDPIHTKYSAELESDYTSNDADRFLKRLSGWRCNADLVVLVYQLVNEVRLIRAAVEHHKENKPPKPRSPNQNA
jgi:hypothetical protein